MADFRLQRELERLAPHGKGNPQPQLTVVGGTVRNTRLIKDKHLKGTLYGEGAPLEFIWWGGAPFRDQVEGQRVDLLGTLGVRTWQGIERLQLTVEDARPGE
jgi:single-stranded DNA-specific DHH superfamily exonuclease